MRKSHPVKKRARFRCRNTGCTELLVNESSRSRHERNSCPLMLNPRQALSTEAEEIPSHEELGLDSNLCRICLKVLDSIQVRKRHEKDVHSFYHKNGKTFSSVPYRSFEQFNEVNSSPQYCHPSDEKVDFLTPTQPFKRRRAVSSSSASFSTTTSVTCNSSEQSSKISVCSETSSDEAVELHQIIGIVFICFYIK